MFMMHRVVGVLGLDSRRRSIGSGGDSGRGTEVGV